MVEEITKELLEAKIAKGFSIGQIAVQIGKSKTATNHHFKKHNLKTLAQEREEQGLKYCPCCKEIKSIDEFYKRRGKEGGSTYCKMCTNADSSTRQVNLKQKCVDYKGGACEICGYDKCIASLEFHHIDSSKKDFQISDFKSHAFSEKIKKELDKCMLLCRNCHGETHFNIHEKFTRNAKGIWVIKK